jgi:hypothetical protein
MDEIKGLINDYISCASYMCNSLRDYYDYTDDILIGAYRRNKNIPKEGNLPDGVYFNFHGSGIFFEFENGEIDVDFGPNDRCDGFDFMRLKDFLLYTKKSSYTKLTDEVFFKAEFDRLINLQFIFNPGWVPSPHLYYLNKKLEC